MDVRNISEPDAGQTAFYEIRVKGCLHPSSDWFDGMRITCLECGETLLTGAVTDQAALHGLLMRVRDLNLPLLSVQKVGDDPV